MANKKITDYPNASSITDDDLFLLADAPGGSMAYKKATGAVVKDYASGGAYQPNGTDVAIEDGGTGSSNAADARIALDVAQKLHSVEHQQGQSDEIPLDSLGFPSDVLDLNTNISRHGLMPKLSSNAAQFFNGLGSWVNPKIDDLSAPDDNTDLNATTSAHGLLPKLAGGTTLFLRADGTWATPPGTGGGSGGNVGAFKQSSNNTNNSASYTDVAGMAFTCISGHRYFFKIIVTYQVNNTAGGIQFRFTAPSVSAAQWKASIRYLGSGTDAFYESSDDFTVGISSPTVNTANSDRIAILEGHFTTSGAGTLQLQVRPQTSTHTSLTTGGVGYYVDADASGVVGTTMANDVLWGAAGDLAYATGNDAGARLAVGSNGQVLKVVSGLPAWAAETAGSAATDSIYDAAGDIVVGTGNNTAARLPKGSDGQVLKMVAGVVTWDTDATGGGGGSNPWPGHVVVASAQAPANVRASADYVCDGTDDEVQINAAILDAAALTANGGVAGGEQRGKVILTGGQFDIENDPIKIRTGVTLEGMGFLTELRAVGLTQAGDDSGSGTGVAVIKMNAATDHLFTIRNLWINANYASGGDAHGIHLASTVGADRTAYPNTNPDPDILMENIFIIGTTTGTRHALWMDTDMRGSIICNFQIRDCSGHGVFIDSSPDSTLTNIHVGGADGDGFRIAGGNVKLLGCKSFYCDTNGFNITSGRGSMVGCESQDNNTGFRISGSPLVCAALVADTCQTDGIIISGNRCVITGFTVFVRGGGRYATMTRGVTFNGNTDLVVMGVVDPTSITTAVSGTYTGARNFVRIPNGGSLISVG